MLNLAILIYFQHSIYSKKMNENIYVTVKITEWGKMSKTHKTETILPSERLIERVLIIYKDSKQPISNSTEKDR